MGLYSSDGSLNVTIVETETASGFGVYNPNGSLRVTLVGSE